jgi:DNA-binding transcriptional regulator YhcF (GntR family)
MSAVSARINTTYSHGDPIARLHLSPDSPIPRFLQLKSQFEYLIITGELPPGSKLPSVRTLSRSLGTSVNTLVRAYRELEAASLVVSNPGSGYFVLGMPLSRKEGHGELRAQTREIVHAAVHHGLALDQIVQIFMAEVADMRDTMARREVIVLCKREGRIDELTTRFRQAIADLGVQVTSVALEDLSEEDESWLPHFMGAEFVVSLLFDIRQARTLLERHGVEIIPILAVPSEEVRERIVHLPPGITVGVVASSVEFVDGMITAVTQFNSNVKIVGTADMGDRGYLEQLLHRVECVVYGTLSRSVVTELVPRSVEPIELVYVPDELSLARLRALLRDGTPA